MNQVVQRKRWSPLQPRFYIPFRKKNLQGKEKNARCQDTTINGEDDEFVYDVVRIIKRRSITPKKHTERDCNNDIR